MEVFVRHCNYSQVSAHKLRFRGFCKERCFHNLVDSIQGQEGIGLTFLLDTFHPMEGTHFLHKQSQYPVIEFKGGTETASFLFMLDYVLLKEMDPRTILYFLEDDYLHLPQWHVALREAFTLPGVDYATLYDHKDKYFFPEYTGLKSEIFHTASCHWRTTPSTTNTYAMLLSTLIRDQAIHRQFSLTGSVSQDHAKFCKLEEEGFKLVSSIPGFSTHLEPAYASPCTNWEELLESVRI